MIARLWTGRVPAAKAAQYLDIMVRIAIPEYRSVAGNVEAWCLYRSDREMTVVKMLSFWTGRGAIAAFAGKDIERARYYEFDPEFLIDMPLKVDLFDVASSPDLASAAMI